MGIRRIAALTAVFGLLLSACTPSAVDSTTTTAPPPAATGVTSDPSTFDGFVEASFRSLVERYPELVTDLGLHEAYDTRADQLDDLSAAHATATSELITETLETMRQHELSDLSPSERLTYESYEWNLETWQRDIEFRLHDWPVHFLLTSYNQGVIGLFTQTHPLSNRNQIEDYLARVEKIPTQVDQVLMWMNDSVDAGVLPPGYVIDITLNQLAADIAGGSAERTAIFASFSERIGELGLNRATVDAYRARAVELIESSFIPSWERLANRLREIRPTASDDISLSRLPDGDGYYTHLLSKHTSTDMSAPEIHELGWAEIERVKTDMSELAEAIGVSDASPSALRASAVEATGWVEPADVAESYTVLVEQAEDHFLPFFSLIPASPVEVIADSAPVAYYVGPSFAGDRPGAFHAGSGGGPVPAYTMPSLAFHEAIPGHHLQIALAIELDLPSPQKFLTSTGHVEGWALYAERLGADTGYYDEFPHADFGRLEFELLRAARLVVDTGIHDLGWTRDEARRVMTEIMDGEHFNSEVDRYALYPGQATAYMVGLLALLDLRDEMGIDVSSPASLAEFHEFVIGQGNVPLSVLIQHEP